MSRRWAPLLLVALLLLPGAIGHGGHEDEFRYAPQRPVERPPPPIPEGYTGPGREPYLSYFQGVWLYGTMSATPLKAQNPVSMAMDGDWVVWEDANRSDIFLFSLSAGEGFYITSDQVPQRHPKISGNVVVYEDHRVFAKPSVMAYFIDTGETRRLSNLSASAKDPHIDYPLVAWIDENVTNPDVWAYSLLNHTAWNIHPGTDRDSTPIVVGERVYWRTYRYNLWDMIGHDTATGEDIQVTSDADIQTAPFTNGEDLLFLSNYLDIGWSIDIFDPDTQILRRPQYFVPDSRTLQAHGDALLRLATDVDYSQIVIRNLTSGATNHVTGNLLLTTDPVIHDRNVVASVRTKDGVSLLSLQVSPFAMAKKPTLTITSPATNAPWLRALVVQGVMQAGPEFTEPSTFTYRIDSGAPQVIPPGASWKFTVDPNGLEPGAHLVTVRATFREGPPISSSIVLNIPAPSTSVDVERAGPAFHAARLMSEFNAYVLDNPGSWVLIPLVLLLTALLVFRLWLWLKPRRRRTVVEYVTPDADDAW